MIKHYQMSQDEKESLIKNLTQDVSFIDELDYFETEELHQELFDIEAYCNDEDEDTY